MNRNVRYLKRDEFVKGAPLGEPGSFALVKGGELEALDDGGREITTKDALRAFLVKEGVAADEITRAADEMGADEVAFPFVLSTAAADRQGDVIKQEGWQLANYLKNPVVLWAHDYAQLPIARASAVYVSGGKLKAVDRFSNDHELARCTATLYRKGFLNAVSVGFRPIKWAWNEDRGSYAADFDECELLEHSAVPVPAHQDALIEARAAGLEIAPVVEWAEKAIAAASTGGLYLPKALIESAIAKTSTRVLVDFGDRAAIKLAEVPAPVAIEVRPPDLKAALEVVKAAGFEVATPAVIAALGKAAEPKPEPAPVAVPAVTAPTDEGLNLDELRALVAESANDLKSQVRNRFSQFHTDQTGRLD